MSDQEIQPRDWLRISAIITAIALLFWTPVESVERTSVLLFSAVICVLAALGFLRRSSDRYSFWHSVLTGSAGGLAVSPIASVLMLFKIGLHGHAVPDFSFSDILATLRLTPFWGIGGLLIGLGFGLWNLSYQE